MLKEKGELYIWNHYDHDHPFEQLDHDSPLRLSPQPPLQFSMNSPAENKEENYPPALPAPSRPLPPCKVVLQGGGSFQKLRSLTHPTPPEEVYRLDQVVQQSFTNFIHSSATGPNIATNLWVSNYATYRRRSEIAIPGKTCLQGKS